MQDVEVDDEIFDDELIDRGETLESKRDDPRGLHTADATLYHGRKEDS